MANRFLASLSQTEQERVQRVANQLTADLGPWVRGWSVINPVRLPTTALTLAAAAPDWDPANLQLLAKVTLWIFSIDDAIDEAQIPTKLLTRKLAAWRTVLQDPCRSHRRASDEYTAILAEIGRSIAKSPLFKPLHAHWRRNFERMFAGMLFERETGRRVRADGPAALPSYAAYLEHGLYSVGVPSFATSASLLRAEPGTLAEWPVFVAMEREAGRALRLANDLRTWQKEAREHNLNALMILQHTYAVGGMPAHAARTWAQREVARQMALCQARCAAMALWASGRIPDITGALARTVDFSVEFYREHDYHTVPADKVARV